MSVADQNLPFYQSTADSPFPDTPIFWEGAHRILDEVEDQFGSRGLRIMDVASRAWLVRSRSRYLQEMDAISQRARRPGVYALNLSYEWSCTVAIGSDTSGLPIMLRAFDWGPKSLGSTLCVVQRPRADGGRYLALTWPLFVGDATVIVSRRFAIALNGVAPRRPIPRTAWAKAFGRARNTLSFVQRTGLPPAHLLRFVAEQAATSEEALAILSSMATCRPAIFCLLGPSLEGSGVVERDCEQAWFRAAPVTAANHWEGVGSETWAEPDSLKRSDAMGKTPIGNAAPMAWCVPPVMNERTRFAAEISLARGEAIVMEVQDMKLQCPGQTIRLENLL